MLRGCTGFDLSARTQTLHADFDTYVSDGIAKLEEMLASETSELVAA